MTSEQSHPPPQRQRGRSPTPWRSWAKLLGPILGLTLAGTVIAIAILGLLALAAAVLFTAWFGMYGSNK
jgi:predicted lipid-binding transport protein (Tim44 family)